MNAHIRKQVFLALALAACAAVFTTSCSRDGAFEIAADGKSPYTIVLSGQASPSEKHAADELRRFIGEAAGAELPIVGENEAGPGTTPRILIGLGPAAETLLAGTEPVDIAGLGDEGFVIRTVAGSGKRPDVVIAGGGKRGTLYGVYTWLHRLGFRWYTTEITRPPEGKRLEAPVVNERIVPPFMYRVPYISEAFDPDWSARNRVHSGGDPADEKRGGKVEILGSHTFDRLIPPELYREHPEYFPLIGGKRVTGYVQRCLSNPEVVKVAAKNMIAWMDENPDWRFFSLGQNDVEKLCECPECTKILEEQGAPSGLFVHFANQVAEIVMKEHPENWISIFAYTFSEKPPKSIRPHEKVIIRMAPIRLCFGHPFPECTSEPARTFVENLDGWARLTDNIFVWHYCTDFPNYLMHFPDFDEFTKDVVNYLDRGVKGIYFQGTYTTTGGADSELRAWVMAQLLWNPRQDADALIDEWLRGVYGPAYVPMRAAFDLSQWYTRDPEHHLFIYDPPTKEMWPDRVVASLDSLHAEAEKLAAGDPAALRQVRKNRMTVEYLKLILNTGVLRVVDDVYRPVGNTVTTADYDRFIALTKEFGVTALREEGMDGSFYEQFRQRLEEHPVATVENEDIRIDTVPNLGGRIVRIIDKSTGNNIVSTGDAYYNYYPVYGGYDEITAWGWDCSGYSNGYEAAVKGRELTLTARNPEGLVFTKVITVAPAGRKFTIRSSIANDSGEPKTYRLVCRMELATRADATHLTARMEDGSFAEPVPTETIDFFWPYHLVEKRFDGPNKPAGAWRMSSDTEGWTVENTFDPSVVETCIWHTCKAKDMVRLDLHTADREVKPGGRIAFTHTWEIK